MAISDKTRKILWGRSGNRCAICKRELIANATKIDDESVIGDECHIISSQPSGPRHDLSYLPEKLSSYENLILLCRVHHKMVDDQYETYTVGILRQIKSNHELWVSEKLSEKQKPRPLKFSRIKQNIPAYLVRLTTGKEVLNLVENSYMFSMDHDELKSESEVELVGDFLQLARDWGDIGADLEPNDRVRAAYNLTNTLAKLEEAGFLVFGGCEVQVCEGGFGEQFDWPVAIIRVLRKDNETIIKVNHEN
jgi:hypothetical protein